MSFVVVARGGHAVDVAVMSPPVLTLERNEANQPSGDPPHDDDGQTLRARPVPRVSRLLSQYGTV